MATGKGETADGLGIVVGSAALLVLDSAVDETAWMVLAWDGPEQEKTIKLAIRKATKCLVVISNHLIYQ